MRRGCDTQAILLAHALVLFEKALGAPARSGGEEAAETTHWSDPPLEAGRLNVRGTHQPQ